MAKKKQEPLNLTEEQIDGNNYGINSTIFALFVIIRKLKEINPNMIFKI